MQNTQRYKAYHNDSKKTRPKTSDAKKTLSKPKTKPKTSDTKKVLAKPKTRPKTATRSKVKTVKVVKKNNTTTKYKYEMDKSSKLSFSTLLTIALIFMGGIVCLLFNATIAKKGENINIITEQISKQEEINANLLVKISSSYDLANIEKVANVKLGMSKPQEYQIIRINVPKESYMVQYTPEETKKEVKKGFSFSKLTEFIKVKDKK